MSDMKWDVGSEDDPLPFLPAEDVTPRRSPPRLIFLLLVLLLAGGIALRLYLQEQEATLRADLTEAIMAEERARLFGQREEASALVVAGAPEAWLEHYLATFKVPEKSQPVEVTVADVELARNEAMVTVQIGALRQRRLYRMEGGGWRRAPLLPSHWGALHVPWEADGAAALSYYDADALFATDLRARLPVVYGSPRALPAAPTIHIQPREFVGGLLEPLEDGAITLNSPQVAQPSGPWSGESEVRLVLAQELLGEVVPPVEHSFALSGAAHLTEAARAVAAMVWALSPEEQARVREHWRALAADEWRSPFFEGTRAPNRRAIPLYKPNRLEVSALVTADYLYHVGGLSALSTLVREASSATSWDSVMMAAVGSFATHVDEEAELYALHDLRRARSVRQRDVTPPPHPTPLTVERMERHPEERGVYLAWLPDEDEPLLVEPENVRVVAADGTELAPNCLDVYGPLTIEGDWLEVGQRLAARRVVVEAMAPPIAPEGAVTPPGTVAYLLRVRKAHDGHWPETVLALGEDGTLTPVLDVNGLRQVQPFRFSPQEPSRFLLELPVPTCGHSWLLAHDPADGRTDAWMAAPGLRIEYPLVIPRAEQGDLALILRAFSSPTDSYAFASLHPSEPGVVSESGRLPPSFQVVGWDARSGRFVGMEPYIGHFGLIEPATGEVERIGRGQRGAAAPFWDPVARRLYTMVLSEVPPYGAQALNSASLWSFDLDTGEEVLLLERPREGFDTFWPTAVVGGGVVVVQGRFDSSQPPDHRLLWLDPENPAAPTLIEEFDESGSGLYLGAASPCPDGSILYDVLHGTEHHLRRWYPERGATTLFRYEGDEMFILACG